VLGGVREPGTFFMEDGKSYRLADALAMAKGLVERGSLRRAMVLTRVGDKFTTQSYNLDEFLKDGRLASNPELKPGDVVLFGQPKGITTQSATQFLSGLLVFNSLLRK
jgi:protein involved in polysaccharide export with SLBB domain